jgi:hypothetical protein
MALSVGDLYSFVTRRISRLFTFITLANVAVHFSMFGAQTLTLFTARRSRLSRLAFLGAHRLLIHISSGEFFNAPFLRQAKTNWHWLIKLILSQFKSRTRVSASDQP